MDHSSGLHISNYKFVCISSKLYIEDSLEF